MYFARCDQDDIGGFQAVGDPLNEIIHIPGKEEQNLEEVMIVAVITFYFIVRQVEQLIGLVQISGFFVLCVYHGNRHILSAPYGAYIVVLYSEIPRSSSQNTRASTAFCLRK